MAATIETVLNSMGLAKYIDLFLENKIDLDLLKDMSETDMEELFTEIELPEEVGDEISERIKTMISKDKEEEHGTDIEKGISLDEVSSPDYCFGKKVIRIVLLGKTGNGKSATGNTILGSEKFKSIMSGESVTRKCSQELNTRFDKEILVVDTPGIFDTTQSNEKIEQEICKCIGLSAPGPHAFILVLNIVARYTDEERRSVDLFEKYFGKDFYNYLLVLFVRKDDLVKAERTLDDHLKTSPDSLKKLLEECGDRKFAFDNTLKGDKQNEQVETLLNGILKNVERNGGKYYTNEMYEKAQENIKKLEEEKTREKEMEYKKIEDAIKQKFDKEFKFKMNEFLELKNTVAELTAKKIQEERRTVELQEKCKKLEEEMEDIKQEHKDEMENFTTRMEQETAKFQEKVREQVRDEIENNTSVLQFIWGKMKRSLRRK